MVNWTILDPNSNCGNTHWVPIRVSGSHLNQHSTWPHLPIHGTRLSSATTIHDRRRDPFCLIVIVVIITIPHPHHLLQISLSIFHFHNYEKVAKNKGGVWNMNPKNQTEELSLDLWELRFSTTVDRNLRYPIQQKAARTCYWNLWPQHSTKERERQEREKNLDFFSSFCRINGLNKNNSNNPLTTELDTAQSSDLYSKMWLKLLCLRIFPAYKSKQRKNEEEEKWTEQNKMNCYRIFEGEGVRGNQWEGKESRE